MWYFKLLSQVRGYTDLKYGSGGVIIPGTADRISSNLADRISSSSADRIYSWSTDIIISSSDDEIASSPAHVISFIPADRFGSSSAIDQTTEKQWQRLRSRWKSECFLHESVAVRILSLQVVILFSVNFYWLKQSK